MACYLIDLDGTIYRGREPLPCAAEFIEYLGRSGQPYRFLTNAPEKSPREIERKLRRLGIPTPKGTVITSSILAVDYIKELAENGQPRTAVFGTPFLQRYAALRGLCLTEQNPEFVLVSFSEELTMGCVRRACGLIRQGARFLATNPDDLIPSEEGPLPHLGGILQAITAATGIQPLIAGKPSAHLRQYFTRLFQCRAEEICVIGDRLDTDMGFARNCGFQAWLLLTGSTTPEEAARNPGDFDRCFYGMREIMEEHP